MTGFIHYRILGAALLVLLLAIGAGALWISHDASCPTAPPAVAGGNTMRAVLHRCYGGPQRASLEQVAQPAIGADEVLVAVHAAGVNPHDLHDLRGQPYLVMRRSTGFGRPVDPRLGTDFAGVVVATGSGVTKFKPGDAVFGGAGGSFAQYVSLRENAALALKPANVSFGQAAAAPVAAVSALRALRDEGHVAPGQRVLINGASGGVGSFAVQIARAFGAEVTAVCGARNAALVRSLGAARVIDYAREDFTRGGERYDLIIDTVGNHGIFDYRRVMKPSATLVTIGGYNNAWFGPLGNVVEAALLRRFIGQRLRFFVLDLSGPADLDTIAGMMASGALRSVIERRYPLAGAAAALDHVEQGHASGKVVIDVAGDED